MQDGTLAICKFNVPKEPQKQQPGNFICLQLLSHSDLGSILKSDQQEAKFYKPTTHNNSEALLRGNTVI